MSDLRVRLVALITEMCEAADRLPEVPVGLSWSHGVRLSERHWADRLAAALAVPEEEPTFPATLPLTHKVWPADVAQAFHEAYERLAPSFGYTTRAETRKPWADVPEGNKQLMTAVAKEVLLFIALRAAPAAEDKVERQLRQEWWFNHGCSGRALYGDDGELQCNACMKDFKREPLETLAMFVIQKRQERVSAQLEAARAAAPQEPKCPQGHVWSNQFGDDWTPDVGTPCDCGKKQWGRAAAPQEP